MPDQREAEVDRQRAHLLPVVVIGCVVAVGLLASAAAAGGVRVAALPTGTYHRGLGVQPYGFWARPAGRLTGCFYRQTGYTVGLGRVELRVEWVR